jgi:HSP20 family molecular chaperone IbpA
MAETTAVTRQEQESAVTGTREDTRYLIPPVDIYETEEGLVVKADMPGVTRETLEIRVDDGLLTISGKPTNGLPGAPVVQEFELLNFYRQFQLSDAVDQEKIEAELKHGVVTIHLPKAEAVKPKRIEVKVA